MARAFRSEWLKLRRPTVLLGGLGAMVAFAILGTVLAIGRAGEGRNALTIARLSQPDGFAFMMARTGDFLGVIALGFTAIAVAQEYSHGTIRNLLVREPRRLRLLGGKMLAILSYVVVAVAVAVAVALVSAEIVAPLRGVDTGGWLNRGLGDSLSVLGNLALAGAVWSVFGALLAISFRSPAPAVIAGVAWTLPVENLLAAAWSTLAHWLPGQQLAALAARGNDNSTYGWALMLTALFASAALTAAALQFRRRDVTA